MGFPSLLSLRGESPIPQSSGLAVDNSPPALQADFVAANSETLSIADNASLSTGNVSFWAAGLFDKDIETSVDVMGKWGGTTNEWLLLWTATEAPQIFVGGSNKLWGSTLTLNTRYFIMIYHDAANDLIGISVNGAAFQTAALVGGPTDGNSAFVVGGRGGGTVVYYDGQQSSIFFGKSPTDSFDTIRDLLYNGGDFTFYGGLTAAQKTSMGLISAWKLDEVSGTRADAHGENDLVDNNTVGSAAY